MDTGRWWSRFGLSVSPAVAVGHNVKRLRLVRGYDQADLARLLRECGVMPTANQATVSRVENAGRPVSVDEVVALSVILEGRTTANGAPRSLFADPAAAPKQQDPLLAGMLAEARSEVEEVRARLEAAGRDMERAEAKMQRLLALRS